MNRISKHISYWEATNSQTAIRKGIENTPNEQQLKNMKLLAEKVFEPLRSKFGAIRVSSFFRSVKVNRAIGGSSRSQHCKGEAIDIQGLKCTNKELLDYIINNLPFDQLINEFPNSQGEPSWVHVSYSSTKNRRQILTAKKINGKTVYIPS